MLLTLKRHFPPCLVLTRQKTHLGQRWRCCTWSGNWAFPSLLLLPKVNDSRSTLGAHIMQPSAVHAPPAKGQNWCLLVPEATCGISTDRQNPTHKFPSRMEANRTLGLRTQSHRDKARRSCRQLMYQGCVRVGGPSVPLWALEERCGHTEQFSSHTGWLETRKQADSFTYYLDACRLPQAEKIEWSTESEANEKI